MSSDPAALTTLDAVRNVIGAEFKGSALKIFDSLDETARNFVAASPFLMLATADAEGWPDVSPKGDVAGFVALEDSRTLLVPDRQGNRMILGLQNILENPKVALIFLVPGTEETLRVQGSAELTADPQVLERLAARGKPALLAIRVRVESAFFHCAKAFKRSELWRPEAWPERVKVSFGKQIAAKLGAGPELAEKIDADVEASYELTL